MIVKVYSLILFSILFSSISAHAAETKCAVRDLRNSRIAPVRNQFYTSSSGFDRDSKWCFAYAYAVVVGNEIGMAVSPEDIALQSSFKYGGAGASEPVQFRRGFHLEHLDSVMTKGFCSVENFDRYMAGLGDTTRWYFNLEEESRKYTSESFANTIEGVCSSRRHLSSGRRVQEEKPIYSVNRKFFGLKKSEQTTELHKKMLEKEIESTLNLISQLVVVDGQYILFGYGNHAVAIVGQEEDCSFIIQDSAYPGGFRSLSREKTKQLVLSDPYEAQFLYFVNQ